MGNGRYLFQFFHEVDVSTVLHNGSWTFNQQTLVLRRLMEDDQVDKIPLNHNVGNIFKYGLLLIDFFCFEKNKSNVEPVKPKSIYVIQYDWA